jgi:hypothetical protein
MRHYAVQVLATAVPSAVTINEVVSGGNLLLATAAALLAVLAGRWALRKQRIEARTAELNLQIAEYKLQRELDHQRTVAPFVPTPEVRAPQSEIRNP